MNLFLTTQDPQTSRNRSLIYFLENDYKNSYKILSFSKKSLPVLFLILYNLIRIYRPQTIIIGYNSRILTLPVYVIRTFCNLNIIYDLGYPISDIPKLNPFRRFLLSLSDFFLIKLSDIVLVESLQQKLYIESKFKRKLVLVYFAYYDFPPLLKDFSLFDFNYFLFRGRLNVESGILTWIAEFLKYKSNGSYKLVILGYGDLQSAVKELIADHHLDIIFLNRYISESELISLVANASCLLGQINSNEDRLQKTIPHKFFESVYFRKVYLGYLYPPVHSIIGNIYYDLGLQLDPCAAASKISELFVNFEAMDKELLVQNVESAFNRFFDIHTSNKNSLASYL